LISIVVAIENNFVIYDVMSKPPGTIEGE